MYINAQGAEIYQDPLRRYVVKIADIRSNHERMPWVNYQDDMYMGHDGARYEVTQHLELVDALGFRSDENAPTEPPEPLAPRDPNLPGTSKEPSTFSFPLEDFFLIYAGKRIKRKRVKVKRLKWGDPHLDGS